MVVGAGHYVAAIGATLLLLVVLVILNILERRLISPYMHGHPDRQRRGPGAFDHGLKEGAGSRTR